MTRLTCGLTVLLFSAAWLSAAPARPRGEVVFRKQKCNDCHSVAVTKIGLTKKKPAVKAPDLSRLGKRRASYLAALPKYLKLQEKKSGKAHARSFKGTDEELQAIVDWLGSLEVRK